MKIYVAIICKDIENINEYDLIKRSAFTSTDKDKVIRAAIYARDEWHRKGNGPYRIFVGHLLTEVVQPVEYQEVAL